MNITLQTTDWLALGLHFLSLSLLAVGGAITTAPDMHRYLVGQQGWLSDTQFSTSITLAQAAPGPNILFVALMGWQIGINAAGGTAAGAAAWPLGLLGVGVTMAAIMLPSTLLTFFATRWAWRHRDMRAVRAFKQGMAPIVVVLLIATAWLLVDGQTQANASHAGGLWLLAGASALIVWRVRLHLLWLLAAGAALGALGLV
jgi:chromate transporter